MWYAPDDRPEVVAVDYSPEFVARRNGTVRPYLWIRVTGPNGRGAVIRGLVDTGADTCVLPLDYAHAMGYTPR